MYDCVVRYSQFVEKCEELADVPGYLVVVRGSEDGIEVRVRDAYARVLGARQAQELLKIIRSNLI